MRRSGSNGQHSQRLVCLLRDVLVHRRQQPMTFLGEIVGLLDQNAAIESQCKLFLNFPIGVEKGLRQAGDSRPLSNVQRLDAKKVSKNDVDLVP